MTVEKYLSSSVRYWEEIGNLLGVGSIQFRSNHREECHRPFDFTIGISSSWSGNGESNCTEWYFHLFILYELEFINLEQTYIDLENQFLEVRKKLSETETENKELREQVAASPKSLQPVVVVLSSILLVLGWLGHIIGGEKAIGGKSLWIDAFVASDARWVLGFEE